MPTGIDGAAIIWPFEALREAIETLITASGERSTRAALADVPPGSEISEWLVDAPRSLGFEGSLQLVEKGELLSHLLKAGSYGISVASRTSQGLSVWFAMVVSDGLKCRVLGRAGYEARCSTAQFVDFLLEQADDRDRRLADIFSGLPDGERIFNQMAAHERLGRIYFNIVTYRYDAASPLWKSLRSQGAVRKILTFIMLTFAQLSVTTFAAFTLGSSALNGIVDQGRITAWIMISLIGVPLSYFASINLAKFTLEVGGVLKRRAIEGTFFIDQGVLRRQGFSDQIARVNEASLLERTTMNDALNLLYPVAMIVVSIYIFATKNNHALAMCSTQLAFIAAGIGLVVLIARKQLALYRDRLQLTGDVVDKVMGHRTRAVQDNPSIWHAAEDRALSAYAGAVARLDSYGAWVSALPRLWIVTSACILGFFFITDPTSGGLVLSAVAVVLFAVGAGAVIMAIDRLTKIFVAWRAVRDLLMAGCNRDRVNRFAWSAGEEAEWPTVLAASAVAYSYRVGARPIFTDAAIRVRVGERILLEGPSGGGKTTFAKIVAGELRPSGGSILVSGLDPFTGSESQWRKLVASVPQFHENHIFSQTFAFNVDPKLGRAGFTDEARAICEELELGPLLAKMPAGPAQLLGETGWQLSHGERSRVFIARALLQDAELVILDESFAALDPITMKTVVECVRRRAKTLMVIAHV